MRDRLWTEIERVAIQCRCGCGGITYSRGRYGHRRSGFLVGHSSWRGGVQVTIRGYVRRQMHGHPRADVNGYVMEHVLIAEKALGKPLEEKHPVHHFNEIKSDNANSNLVICEDKPYHRLLHARQRVKQRGGDPDLQKICCHCQTLKLKREFNTNRGLFDGLAADCRACRQERKRSRAA